VETKELLKKVRKIEIKTRGLSKHVFAGQYHSAFKGKGMAFSEVREYHYGDDIRNIDWNVTARFNHPYIKVFEEERELTVMLLVDVSGSQNFGTGYQLKKDIITEISAVLAFSAIQNNDKVGLILFSDKIEKFISPQKGSSHILRIIRELIGFTPENKNTNISEALRYLTNAIKRRSIAFVISDFIDFDLTTKRPNFEEALKIANNKHDLVALRIFDKRETEIPPVGLIQAKDAETGKVIWVDTANKTTRNIFSEEYRKNEQILSEVFMKSGVDNILIETDSDYIKPLIRLFKKRV
jgi:uncharacterized protein (DUF58 family)